MNTLLENHSGEFSVYIFSLLSGFFDVTELENWQGGCWYFFSVFIFFWSDGGSRFWLDVHGPKICCLSSLFSVCKKSAQYHVQKISTFPKKCISWNDVLVSCSEWKFLIEPFTNAKFLSWNVNWWQFLKKMRLCLVQYSLAVHNCGLKHSFHFI